MKKILVIGSANVDMIMGLPRLPEKGETVSDGVFKQTFGGKGANQAVAAKRAGVAVSMLTCLGEDDNGRAVSQALAADGIDLSWTVTTTQAATGAALIMFDAKGTNYLAVAPGSNFMLMPEHVAACAGDLADYSMIMLQCEIPDAALHAAFKAAAHAGVPVLFNHAPARKLAVAIQPAANDGFVVNEVEATALTDVVVQDTASAFAAARKLRLLGYRFVIVTLGVQGACVVSEVGEEHVSALKVDSVDSTAAGDTFCGALAALLVEGASLLDAVRFATAAAALCVQRVGAQPSIPHRQEIDALMAQLKSAK